MAKWENVVQTGTRAGQPTPTADQIGVLYFVSDEDVMERWSGSAWVQVAVNAGGVPEGSSFPTPSRDHEPFYRTDIRGGMAFRWNATHSRWLSEVVFSIAYFAANISANSSPVWSPIPLDYPIWVTEMQTTFFRGDTGVWTVTVREHRFDASSYPTIATRAITASQAASKWWTYQDAIDVEVDGTAGNTGATPNGIDIIVIKTSGASTYANTIVLFKLSLT